MGFFHLVALSFFSKRSQFFFLGGWGGRTAHQVKNLRIMGVPPYCKILNTFDISDSLCPVFFLFYPPLVGFEFCHDVRRIQYCHYPVRL